MSSGKNHYRFGPAALALTLLLPVGLAAGIIRFTEVSQPFQVRGYPYFNGVGCAWVDVNHDGRPDLFVQNQQGTGTPVNVNDILYINYGTYFVDEAIARGIADGYPGGTHGAVFAPLFGTLRDFDAFISTTYAGVRPAIDHLYRNLGNGFFENDTSSIIPAQTTPYDNRGVAIADFDKDGDLDIFFSNPLPDPFNPTLDLPTFLPNMLINNGRGAFTPMYHGVDWNAFVEGVACADIDNDGDIDIAEAKWAAPSTIYLNDGLGNFRDAGKEWNLPQEFTAGTQKHGVTFGDIDNDGLMDLAIVGDGAVAIYKNKGDHFVLSQRISTSRSAATGSTAGYQVAFGDFDQDGYPDMYFGGENLYRNDGTGTFLAVPAATSGMTASPAMVDPRSIALGDFDGDGDLDIYVVDAAGPNLLFRNETNSADWIKVEIGSDPGGALGGFGSKVDLYAAGHLGEPAYLRGHREIQCGYGYLAQDQPVAHLGAPSAGGAKYDVRVTFPDGSRKSVLSVTPGQTVQGSAVFPPASLLVKKIENNALFYRELIFELTWQANPLNLHLAKYRLYDVTQTPTLLAELPATQLGFTLRNADRNKAYKFALTAVDDGGGESEPVTVSPPVAAADGVSRRSAAGKVPRVVK